ncbi:transcriptional regulator [Niastella koreensis]|uniref:Transcriptional regulator, AraC family n=2 Tax=Niastella koreensis TaxID=354356 RepID=G8T8K0_NIAKG|nr:helix-turn-helix domain-containing protein [Niastella koreensis]AEW00172.1 transcriptional regulator, AraC family [Niastella koreensis GR20-10]OQP49524.1 transcriptional regulator [Niastella koreensis]
MNKREDISGFYERIDYPAPERIRADKPHINIFERASCIRAIPFSRRDYYKVTLILGTGRLDYANQSFNIDRPALVFSNPMIPYNWDPHSTNQQGWFCIFNQAFIQQREGLLNDLPMFRIDTDKVFFPDADSVDEIAAFFKAMMRENVENYVHKYDILRNYLHLIVHHALKMQPTRDHDRDLNAAARIANLFLELLNRQFPVDSRQNVLQLRSAKDFAKQLSLHTNHLNRAVKDFTGKTTTEHIAARILLEANDLLRNTDWPIAEIGYCLGFQYPGYFNSFYKKHAGTTPNELRKHAV